MAKVVIADAGSLIALAGIDCLNILKSMFHQVQVVDAVVEECLAKQGKDADRIKRGLTEGWLSRQTVKVNESVSLSPSLGSGEIDSIKLALLDRQNTLLILDDRLARRSALHAGVNIIGTVRLLDIAEKKQIIPSAEDAILKMFANGYRVSLELLAKIRTP